MKMGWTKEQAIVHSAKHIKDALRLLKVRPADYVSSLINNYIKSHVRTRNPAILVLLQSIKVDVNLPDSDKEAKKDLEDFLNGALSAIEGLKE